MRILHFDVVGVRLVKPSLAGREVHGGGEFWRRVDEIPRVGREAENIFQVDEDE